MRALRAQGRPGPAEAPQPRQAKQPQHPEDAQQEGVVLGEETEEEGQDGDQVDQCPEGEQVAQPPTDTAIAGILTGGIDAGQVLDGEEHDEDDFHAAEDARSQAADGGLGLEDRHQGGQQDQGTDDLVDGR